MPSAFRDPKTLPRWLEADYPRRPRRLWRPYLFALAAVALLALVVPVFVGLLPGGRQIYESGPVSQAHALWNNDCRQCHQAPFGALGRLVTGNDRASSVPEAACLRCHDGPPHVANERDAPACASCHHEHRGRERLVQVGDSHCLACHTDLSTRPDWTRTFHPRIAGFQEGEHPPFGQWRGQGGLKDPATLHFPHDVHLRDGLFRPDGSKTKLDCRDCHVPDAAGRYMMPIRYQDHCQSCHPLHAPLAADPAGGGLARAAARFRAQPLTHPSPGGDAGRVRAELRERYLRFLREQPEILAGPLAPRPERPIPGPRPAPPVAETELAWANYQLALAERLLWGGSGGCAYCHQKAPASKETDLPAIAAVGQPARWFPHSVFSHASHRSFDCQSCHSQAAASKQASDVLMPAIAACRQCHTGEEEAARSSCVTCHLYHHEGHSQGRPPPLSLQEALRR